MEKIYTSPNTNSLTVYRLGNSYVNWYVLHTSAGFVVIDTGLPQQWRQINHLLQQLGHSLTDVKHILLTHAHPDHLGTAEYIRQHSSATVWVHQQEQSWATGSVSIPPLPIGTFVKNLWRPAVIKMMWSMIKEGGSSFKPITQTQTFTDQQQLEIPGRPQVFHVPGHSPGSSAFYFADQQLLFSGDALVTFNFAHGQNSPPILGMGQDLSLMRQSLQKFQHLQQIWLLPGHGNPWSGYLPERLAVILN